MASYWIVVRRDNGELYQALKVAFRGRTGFRVVLDRRVRPEVGRPAGSERREAPVGWGRDEFIVAERTGGLPALAALAPMQALPIARTVGSPRC